MSTYGRKSIKYNLAKVIDVALSEDLSTEGDITSNAIIPLDLDTEFSIVAREELILCGVDVPKLILEQSDTQVRLKQCFKDGDLVPQGAKIIEGFGNAISILSSERTILNILQHLCGISSYTKKFVDLVKHTKAVIRDTRKTLPGLRELEKYAVKIGGGENHRFTLDESFLIKDNHIALCGGDIKKAFDLCKAKNPDKVIEIECDTLKQVEQALSTNCDIILLDNMLLKDIKKAVLMNNNKRIKLEASGGVNLNNVKEIAEAGVDYIAVGGLTHSVKASDIGLDI